MKKLLLGFSLLLIISYVDAQNSWLQKANYGGGKREAGCAFSIGDSGYFMTGLHGDSDYFDMWAWHQSTNTWIQRASLPAAKRMGCSSASLYGFGYLAGGEHPSMCFRPEGGVCGGSFYNDLWRYNPDSNSWKQLANFPGVSRNYAVMVADPDDTALFYGTGNDNGATGLYDWWMYKIPTNTWAIMDSFRGAPRFYAVGFYANGNIYLGTGNDGSTIGATSDLWQYNVSTNTWKQVASLPGPVRRQAVAFSIGNNGYVCMGSSGDSTYLNDLWIYNAVNNSWVSGTSYPQGGGFFQCAFAVGTNGYVGIGTKGQNDTSTFWEYTPDSLTGINELKVESGKLKVYPNPSNGVFTIESSVVSGQSSVEVYNVLGEMVQSFNIQNSTFKIDLSGQSAGVYFYQLLVQGKPEFTGKFVITH